jgi:hypothetical protein
MSNNFMFSYIIPYKHDIQRWNNLKRVLEWVNGMSGAQAIVVEQDTHSKIGHLAFPAKHIFLKTKMPFNKAWAFNCALKHVQSPVTVFGDCDLIMAPQKFIDAMNLIGQYEMVNPYSSVIDLSPQESGMQFEQLEQINRPGRGETDIQKVPLCGGICIFRTDAIMKIGGWNEDFIGWGAEDDFQSIKVKHFLTWHEQKAKCFHLFHDRPAPDIKWYQRNLALYNKLKDLPKEEQAKRIAASMNKIGMKNKYDNF